MPRKVSEVKIFNKNGELNGKIANYINDHFEELISKRFIIGYGYMFMIGDMDQDAIRCARSDIRFTKALEETVVYVSKDYDRLGDDILETFYLSNAVAYLYEKEAKKRVWL